MIDKCGRVLLAIDAAVAGGSAALSIDGKITASISTNGQNSYRAENMLSQIEELLASADLDPKSITDVVVSAGPGSFTGIRIGLSTGLGLCRGSSAQMAKIPLMAAMAAGSLTSRPEILVPMGRGGVCSQSFDVSSSSIVPTSDPHILEFSDLRVYLSSASRELVVLSADLIETSGDLSVGCEITVLSATPAELLLNAFGDSRIPHDSPAIFISKESTRSAE